MPSPSSRNAFAIGQRIFLTPCLEREFRVYGAKAMYGADCIGELGLQAILEQIAAHPGVERTSQITGARKSRQQ